MKLRIVLHYPTKIHCIHDKLIRFFGRGESFHMWKVSLSEWYEALNSELLKENI